MERVIQISDRVTVGPQPTADEIRRLGERGFRSVVNFRTEGEEDQPLSPGAEGEEVRGAGLAYLHIPVSMKAMGPGTVDEFRREFAELPGPVFAHCKSGKRAGAMVMMQMAVERGISGDEALQQAEAMGFECDQPEIKEFVRSYVDGHARGS